MYKGVTMKVQLFVLEKIIYQNFMNYPFVIPLMGLNFIIRILGFSNGPS
jgi:hypothetical protein